MLTLRTDVLLPLAGAGEVKKRAAVGALQRRLHGLTAFPAHTFNRSY